MQPVDGRDVRIESAKQQKASLFTTGLLAVRDCKMQLAGKVSLHNYIKQQCFL